MTKTGELTKAEYSKALKLAKSLRKPIVCWYYADDDCDPPKVHYHDERRDIYNFLHDESCPIIAVVHPDGFVD